MSTQDTTNIPAYRLNPDQIAQENAMPFLDHKYTLSVALRDFHETTRFSREGRPPAPVEPEHLVEQRREELRAYLQQMVDEGRGTPAIVNYLANMTVRVAEQHGHLRPRGRRRPKA